MANEENSRSILIVEDEKLLRDALAEKFLKKKYTVYKANDGLQGLEEAKSKHPSIILLDIVMPIMDGIEMLEKLREDEWGKDAVVIILSNISEANRLDQASKLGVKEFMLKAEWKLASITEKVEEVLSKS